MAGLIPFNRNQKSLRAPGFDDFYNVLDDFFADAWPRRNLLADTFKIDVQDCGSDYCVEAEMPGVKKEEINLELNEGRLSISVQREENSEETKKNYIHKERRYGSVCRSIYLGNVTRDEIKAKLEDGVLKIMVPKEPKAVEQRKIDID